jgi:hypothetical protein
MIALLKTKLMNRILRITFALLTFCITSYGQFTTITYDLERNWFNEGQPLPAETDMIFKGSVPPGATRVELVVLSSKKQEELYTAVWNKTNTNDLSLIVPYKLRAASEYDFLVRFFQPVSSQEKTQLIQNISNTLGAYMEVNLTGDKSIKLLKNSKKNLRDMNQILSDLFLEYRSSVYQWQPAFSEIIRLKLEQMERADLDDNFSKTDTLNSKKQVINQARTQLIDELKDQIDREVAQLFDRELFLLKDTRFVDNYSTETKENSLAINVGYGGVYLSGNVDDFTYGSSPYLGLAFPLGNRVLGSNFLSNTSLTLGVFLDNFKDANQNEVTGLLIDRPFYLGLDHKIFKFVRFNAGAAFLEERNLDIGSGMEDNRGILIRPFVGLSARIDLSIGLGK